MEAGAVSLNGSSGDVNKASDLRARVAERDQAQDFDFPPAEPVSVDALLECLDPGGQKGADELLALCCASDRGRQFGIGPVLEYDAHSSRVQCPLDKRGTSLHRQYDDLGIGETFAKMADSFDTRSACELKVEHDHVREVPVRMLQHARDVACLDDHLDSVLFVQQEPEVPAHACVVVGQQDPDGGGNYLSIRARRGIR